MKQRLVMAIEDRDVEFQSMKKKLGKLKKGLSKFKTGDPLSPKAEEELDELEHYIQSTQGLIAELKKRKTFQFLTDVGWLPNYAFPEAGVILRSLIYRKRSQPREGQKYKTEIFEYQRPSVSALHELAPDNVFYAESRKVKIDQVNMELSELEEWRFCAECSWMERLGEKKNATDCPKCGSGFWGDDGQKRNMLRMRQVLATTDDREARIQDDSDIRSPEIYLRNIVVNLDPEKGNIDHLQATLNEESTDGFRRKVLYIYDTIPGGTGYLKDLMRAKVPLVQVFEEALYQMQHCSCIGDENKDGCYRCLYAYRNSYSLGQISRRKGVELFQRILKHKKDIIAGSSIAKIPIHQLAKSELEKKFLQALETGEWKGIRATIREDMVHKKPGYIYTINGHDY